MANVKVPVRVYKTFQKVGKEVKFIATGEGNPRNGEGFTKPLDEFIAQALYENATKAR